MIESKDSKKCAVKLEKWRSKGKEWILSISKSKKKEKFASNYLQSILKNVSIKFDCKFGPRESTNNWNLFKKIYNSNFSYTNEKS